MIVPRHLAIAWLPFRGQIAFGAAFLILICTGRPVAACEQKPEAPACAVATVPFASADAADDCRREMLKFRDAMDHYATCLGQTSADDEKQARADYEDIRVRFNRRARGEFGKTPGTDGPE